MVAAFFLFSRSSFWGGWWWFNGLCSFGGGFGVVGGGFCSFLGGWWWLAFFMWFVILNTWKYFTIKIFTCKIFYIETNEALMLISMEKNEFWFEWWNPIHIWICIFWLLVKFWLRIGEMKNKERIKNKTKIFKCSAKIKKELMLGVL